MARPADVTFRAQVQDVDIPLAVAPRRDPQRTALAAIITFIVAIVGLWAILAYMHSMARTLSSINASNTKVIGQLETANDGLADLDRKTSHIKAMNANTGQLQQLMAGLDSDLGTMLEDVDRIGRGMGTMQGSLSSLDGEITAVGASNRSVAGKLGGINRGLQGQARQVRGMRRDVQATARELGRMPAILRVTNSRLTFINRVVCQLGTRGIIQQLRMKVTFLGIPNGSADIRATMIPPGGWGC